MCWKFAGSITECVVCLGLPSHSKHWPCLRFANFVQEYMKLEVLLISLPIQKDVLYYETAKSNLCTIAAQDQVMNQCVLFLIWHECCWICPGLAGCSLVVKGDRGRCWPKLSSPDLLLLARTGTVPYTPPGGPFFGVIGLPLGLLFCPSSPFSFLCLIFCQNSVFVNFNVIVSFFFLN